MSQSVESGVAGRGRLGMLLACLPGLALSGLVAIACTWAAASGGRALFATASSPISPVLAAIVAGALLGTFVRWPALFTAGLQCATTAVLRIGIALIGLRLALISLGTISIRAAPVVIGCLLMAGLVIPRICRWFGVNRESSILLTVGTAICGCTAVLAIAPILRASAAQTGYAVATVMLLGLCGVIAYPFLAHLLFAHQPLAAGIFLGTAIHDTSQVVGAGLVYAQQFHSPQALAAATVAKLLRNLSLAAVVPALAWREARARHSGVAPGRLTTYVPWFVVGFILCVIARTVGDTVAAGHGLAQPRWQYVLTFASHTADWCLTIGMAATGMTLSRAGLSSLGVKPLLAGLCAAALVAVTSLLLLLAIF
ncbi:MAG TPA: putative sulfate exporter family transporter [Steroidobacteraceae bacterium]|jgi:uncharacterized integral membrane protein (TIGR00698 family)|nr:putative sulfate exporter family transporter [Steroidobacteraceae bacterium]